MKRICYIVLLLCISRFSFSQNNDAAKNWADSVFSSLTPAQRIAQLMVVRTSSTKDGQPIFFDAQVDSLVKIYNIGAVCLFQGTSQQQAALLNRIQGMAKTPIMVTVDAEWGLGMRFADVQNLPYQLTIGATPDAEYAYKVGKAIAEQCKRIGVHVNYAPVVDINNNPNNPVIGIRSFGEDKYKVALFGSRIMQGMQDNGVMACAKHFPGHGDVDVDSHLDLPVINKSMGQLDSLELYPFREVFNKGIGSVMVAHLSIPAIDSTKNRPTSLSYNNITTLMRNKLGYDGLTFTDALEMQGVAKYYPRGEAAVQSMIAGNDMLCLPGDVPLAINKIEEAVTNKRLSWEEINDKCKRVLLAKYQYVVGKTNVIDTTNLTQDLNKNVAALRKEVAENALTVVRLNDGFLPTKNEKVKSRKQRENIAYLSLNMKGADELTNILKDSLQADVIDLSPVDTNATIKKLAKYNRVIISLHNINRFPKNNFGISQSIIETIHNIEKINPNTLVMVFGNCYSIKNFCDSKNLVVCYEDDSVFHQAAANWLMGKFPAKGTLPVTVCSDFKFGDGIVERNELPVADPKTIGLDLVKMTAKIDSLAADAIAQKVAPGCVVTVLKDGKLAFQKAYGHQTYDGGLPITTNTLYDLASCTKISATNVSVMKLWEDGKLDLKQKIGFYLPWLKGSNKENLTVENLLLHQAGMVSFIPFYKNVEDKNGIPFKTVFADHPSPGFNVPVADSFYMRNDYVDTMFEIIKTSVVNTTEMKYIYSDNDFILMGKIVEAITGKPLDVYVKETFYNPLGMRTTGFKPFEHFANSEVAPTEVEKGFRRQMIHGYVHDPGAAMFGNVAGHAGLFSDGYDLAILYQMLLNGGTFGGKQYLKKETIDWFTGYHSPISNRGMGWDKPEKDQFVNTSHQSYLSKKVSPLTYGHTGFTGICIWVDPAVNLVYIFMSNRVNPVESSQISKTRIRATIQDAIYEAMGK